MREWLAIRRLRLYENAERAFANSISQTAMQLSFVKRARVDLQTSLGGRKGAGGVDVAGALRESDDDIVGWQLRAYAGEDSAKGLNSGLFYRRIVNGALAGVNVFADYEDGDDGDFWRWSIGGDVKNRFGELSANHYFAITDAQMVGGKKTYTREGYDVDIAARIPRLEWAKARIGYYNFKGEFGDEDETGLRGGLDLSPGKGVVFGVEYDGEDGSFGGNISYTHTFGETSKGAQRTGDFNPRAHFYDAVRREYSQRISRTSGGGGGLVIVGTGVDVEVKNEAMTVTVEASADAVNATFPLANSITVTDIDADNGTITMRGGAWHLTLFGTNNPTVEFLNGTVINIVRGMGSFNSGGGNISEVVMDGERITLLGTRFDFNVVPGSDPLITLREGALGIPASGVDVQVADSASVRVGDNFVSCAGGTPPAGVRVNCSIGTGDGAAATVTAPAAGDVFVGAYTIDMSRNASDISTRVSPADFTRSINGRIIRVFLSVLAAADPDPNDKLATLHLTDTKNLVQMSAVVFTVRVNPQPLAVSPVGTPNTAPMTTSGDIIIATLQVANGYADGRRAMIVGNGGNFSLTEGTLILRGNNTAARMTAVTIRGMDAHNTDSNFLSITVAVDATPQPLMPVCTGTCRTLTVTAHNVSDLSSADITTGSVNWRFLLDGKTLQTENKVLATLYDNSGLTLTITDEQVRGMLGVQSGDDISVTIINNQVMTVITTPHITLRYEFGAQYAIATSESRVSLTISRTSDIREHHVVLTVMWNLGSFPSNEGVFRIIEGDLGDGVGAYLPRRNSVLPYTLTAARNADIDLLQGLTVIAPLGAGGGSGTDSALLELQFSQPQLWQVSYLSNTNQPVRLSSFPRRRESPRALGG